MGIISTEVFLLKIFSTFLCFFNVHIANIVMFTLSVYPIQNRCDVYFKIKLWLQQNWPLKIMIIVFCAVKCQVYFILSHIFEIRVNISKVMITTLVPIMKTAMWDVMAVAVTDLPNNLCNLMITTPPLILIILIQIIMILIDIMRARIHEVDPNPIARDMAIKMIKVIP